VTTDERFESGHHALLRFGLSGIVFTILGPMIFWLTYPLGPIAAVAVTELTVHAMRFGAFRMLVFPARKGYRVNLARYVLSALPMTCTGFASVALLHNHLSRTELTVAGTLITVLVSFVWTRFIYKHPVMPNVREQMAKR